jgi:hypothetical protein
MKERDRIARLLERLKEQPIHQFPKVRESLQVSRNQGVYVIRNPKNEVVHVGRTLRGHLGLQQRLRNHLAAQSSFVMAALGGDGSRLRTGYTYQYLEVPDDRERALLEHIATAWHCPQHLGDGAKLKVETSHAAQP